MIPIRRWLFERFPPLAYTILVVMLWGSTASLAHRFTGEAAGWAIPTSAVVTWLFFLHLRIFDEHKDFEEDRVTYPDRVLSRGEVTLRSLAMLGAVAIALEVLLAASLGWLALGVWGWAFAYSVAMRFEFGVRSLRGNIVLYALTHNPVVGLLVVFLHVAATGTLDVAAAPQIAMVSFASLAFEIARKTRRADEEHAGVASYTSELGQTGARSLLLGVYALTGASLSGTLLTVDVAPWVAAILGGLVAVGGGASCVGLQSAATVERTGTLVMLGCFVITGVAAWT
jgi:4-hydroxybenzoate polyprenyltransferase